MPANQVVADFTDELRALWHAAGRPSYRELARRTHYGRSTLHEALQGTRLPSSDVTARLVAALGGDVEGWRGRWASASRALDVPPGEPAGMPRPAPDSPDTPDAPAPAPGPRALAAGA
ncbi:MAG TPA: helix-turn-helix transcriptional regulator, partial [Pseudonocardiaceae bacterium]